MKLDDFEYYFDEKILERGKIIFESGKVKCLKSFMNYWDFIVPGTKNYDVTIGLEVHCELKSISKVFSGSSNKYSEDANTNVSAIDMAFPGIL
ncbi:MAG: hypothetical protein IKJ72_02330, partial [Mycoplasmataceae bacterium]|nr:hypothetical protein [Mycoplasmataceae bacterium]